MTSRQIWVFHGKPSLDQSEIDGLPSEVLANPPLTPQGKKLLIEQVIPHLKKMGPYGAVYSGRLDRVLGTASAIVHELGDEVDLQTMYQLSQRCGANGKVITPYPGHEHESYREWQDQAVLAARLIAMRHKFGQRVLVVSTRPMIGGLLSSLQGVTDPEGIEKIAMDPDVEKNGYRIFNVDCDGEQAIALVE